MKSFKSLLLQITKRNDSQLRTFYELSERFVGRLKILDPENGRQENE